MHYLNILLYLFLIVLTFLMILACVFKNDFNIQLIYAYINLIELIIKLFKYLENILIN